MNICFQAKEFLTAVICGPGSARVAEAPDAFDLTKLPKQIGTPLLELSRQFFGCSTSSLLAPAMTVAGAALGNGFVLETELFPAPLNACLGCGLIGDENEAEWMAELLTQPLREEQDQRIAVSANTPLKVLRKSIRDIESEKKRFFGKALLRDAAAESSFERRTKALYDQLYPVLIVEDPVWVAKTSWLAELIDFSVFAGSLFGDVVFDFDDPPRPPFRAPVPFSALAGKYGTAAATDGAQALGS